MFYGSYKEKQMKDYKPAMNLQTKSSQNLAYIGVTQKVCENIGCWVPPSEFLIQYIRTRAGIYNKHLGPAAGGAGTTL